MSDVSESLISLTKNEQMSESLIFLSESLIFGQKTSNSLGNQMSEFSALSIASSVKFSNSVQGVKYKIYVTTSGHTVQYVR